MFSETEVTEIYCMTNDFGKKPAIDIEFIKDRQLTLF